MQGKEPNKNQIMCTFNEMKISIFMKPGAPEELTPRKTTNPIPVYKATPS